MINLFGGTDVGLVRKSNQDRFQYRILSGNLAFAVLCDGMGGQKGGNVASDLATRFVTETLERTLREDMGEPSLRAAVLSAVAGANALVWDTAQQDPSLSGMGTTLLICVFTPGHLFVASVGDSRVYHVRGTAETQLTKDHTVVQMLVDDGKISEEAAQTHPDRRFITRAVGVLAEVEADFLEQSLEPGDFVLLCSDGLYHYLEPGSLHDLLTESARLAGADNLLELANNAGGADNITAVVALYGPDEGNAKNG